MVAVNMVAESGEDGIVGRYVNVSINHTFYLPLNINQINEPPLGTKLKNDANARVFYGFFIRERREETRFLDVILPQDGKYLPLEELVRRLFIGLSHDAKIPFSRG